jgi:hypothetical protein
MTRVVVATALLLVGLASFGLWRVLSGNEDLPFAAGATAPTSVHVTRDNDYMLAVPGGVKAMLARGVPSADANGTQTLSLDCTWSLRSGDQESLTVSPESTSTKATNTVGRFTAPVTGNVRINCSRWGAMFVPDADNRSSDTSGWTLLVAIITLTVGAGLGLSELRLAWESGRAWRGSAADGEDDEVERFVDVSGGAVEDLEVRGDNGGDVGA